MILMCAIVPSQADYDGEKCTGFCALFQEGEKFGMSTRLVSFASTAKTNLFCKWLLISMLKTHFLDHNAGQESF